MGESIEANKQEWLAGVRADPKVTEVHLEVAELIFDEVRLTDDQTAVADELVRLGFALRNGPDLYPYVPNKRFGP